MNERLDILCVGESLLFIDWVLEIFLINMLLFVHEFKKSLKQFYNKSLLFINRLFTFFIKTFKIKPYRLKYFLSSKYRK